MSETMVIPYVRDDRWGPGVRLVVRVDGAVQPDRVLPWGRESGAHPPAAEDFYGTGVYGFTGGAAVGYGGGLYGAGVYGIGAEVAEHVTLAAFAEGDYAVSLTPVDAAGNAAPGTPEVETIQHRPVPGAPRGFAISGDQLVWAWP